MITYKHGNLLDVNKGPVIHGCNAQGVMGSGVALAIKTKYPKAYTTYRAYQSRNGLPLASFSMCSINAELYIANLVTQERYGRDPSIRYVSYGAVLLGFENLENSFHKEVAFHFPKLGAGLANGDWNVIANLIELACPKRELVCWTI